jgi:hypothetical protein
VQAARASVEGFSPYYNTRVSNIWLRD